MDVGRRIPIISILLILSGRVTLGEGRKCSGPVESIVENGVFLVDCGLLCDPGYEPEGNGKGCAASLSPAMSDAIPPSGEEEASQDEYGSYYEYNYSDYSPGEGGGGGGGGGEEEEYSSGEESYDTEDYEDSTSSSDNETQILYQNYEILSNFYKKYYVDLRVIDTSCTPESHPPPALEHGYVSAFQTRANVLLPHKSYNVLLYACEVGFVLSEESSGELFCQENGWIGIHPSCEEGESNPGQQEEDAGKEGPCQEGFQVMDGECGDVDECRDDNGGCEEICINVPGAFECQCSQGFVAQGTECLDEDECLSNNGHGPCHDACTNNVGGFLCSCENIPGSILGDDGVTCIPNNDLCRDSNNGCSHDCVTSQGQAFCLCPEGLKLHSDWKTCIEIEEEETTTEMATTTTTTPPTTSTAVSTSTTTSTTTTTTATSTEAIPTTPPERAPPRNCDTPGFAYDEDLQACVDVDECLLDEGVCEGGFNEQCFNTNGSYVCECLNGYVRGSEEEEGLCEDLDECLDGNACGWEMECVNLPGSFRCDCRRGYELNPEGHCSDHDECSESHRCRSDQICVNTPGSYTCNCPPGFKDHMEACVDIDECSNAPCEQLCVNTPGSYKCDCRPGYRLNTKNTPQCFDIDECLEGHSCEQVCQNTQGSYNCSCNQGFELMEDREGCLPSCESNCRYKCTNGSCTQEKTGCSGDALSGSFNCSSSAQNMFQSGELCASHCVGGVETLASCGFNGSWTFSTSPCGPSCPPLVPYFESVRIEPSTCSSEKQRPSTICSAVCPPGYDLIGTQAIRCQENYSWSYPDGEPNCLANEEKEKELEGKNALDLSNGQPYIHCPGPIRATLGPEAGKMLVEVPVLDTNVNWENDVFSEPVWAKDLRFELSPGAHSIRFSAHRAGFTPDVCFLNISVIDVNPPKVYRCPESFSVQAHNKKIYWKEPLFGDNVRVVHIVTNRLPGSRLPLGVSSIVYEARDNMGNRIRCSFEVNVTRKKRFRKREWVLCRIGSMGRQIKLLSSSVPQGCRRLPY